MNDAWRTLLDEPVASAKDAAQTAVKQAFASLTTSLRVEAITNRFCRTCDQDVPEDVRSRLTASLPAGATAVNAWDYAGIAALARRSDLDGFQQKDVRAEVRLIWEAIRQARLNEADAQAGSRTPTRSWMIRILKRSAAAG